MRRAGMTEETYRETFQLAELGRARRIGNQLCGHPYIYYEARGSLNYDGFDIYFTRVVPDDDLTSWRSTTIGVNITKCGSFGGFLGQTSKSRMFLKRERLDYDDPPEIEYERHAAMFRPCP
jgi:hypothetical protein